MSYTKTSWQNDAGPALNSDNLNKIENGIFLNDSNIAAIANNDTNGLINAINACLRNSSYYVTATSDSSGQYTFGTTTVPPTTGA